MREWYTLHLEMVEMDKIVSKKKKLGDTSINPTYKKRVSALMESSNHTYSFYTRRTYSRSWERRP